MTYNELNKKIDSDNAAEIFSELYEKNEADAARRRYTTLITDMHKNESDFHETEVSGKVKQGAATEDFRVFSAPGRTELAGNHTDHNRGKVLAASIHLDSAAVAHKRDDSTVFFRSTGFPDVRVKLTDSSGAPCLSPKPEEEGTTEALVRGIAAELNRRGCAVGGFSANADSTVHPGSGLSSSAAVEVLLCRIFDTLYDEGKRDSVEIAQIGQIAENVFFGKPCGLMDQIACACGGAVAIDFADAALPEVKRINFDLSAAGYALCVVNTGGSHADLTSDYASVPAEMKAVAAFFDKSVLREIDKETIIANAAEVRKKFGDRALLRAIHFFDENERVDAMTAALIEMENTATAVEKQRALNDYLSLVNESGDSSWQLLQNVFSPHHPDAQGISAALALTKNFFRKQKLHGACRVHGGGFAGTIQAYLPLDAMDAYRANIESVFGAGSLTLLRIRPVGTVELVF